MKLRNGRERALWDAAYAAAWVSQFRQNEEICSRMATRAGDYFDRPLENTSPEQAIVLADACVQKLRDWRREENPEAGK